MGPLPEVSGYLGYLSAPSQEPAFMGCPPARALSTIKRAKARHPDPHGRPPDRIPGAGQTSILCPLFLRAKRGAFWVCDSLPAPDNSCGGGFQVASQGPTHEAAQIVAMFEVPDVSFKTVRATFTDSMGSIYLFVERYYEPGTVQGSEDTMVTKTEMSL